MPGPAVFPAHAYVPGQTDRHPEGWFDAIRNTATPGMAPEALAQSDAFRTGLLYLETGYYWEAHEVLEPVWMVLPDGSAPRRMVQALIQLANARLKSAMDRPKAARRLCGIVRDLLSGLENDAVMGIETAQVLAWVDSLEQTTDSAL